MWPIPHTMIGCVMTTSDGDSREGGACWTAAEVETGGIALIVRRYNEGGGDHAPRREGMLLLPRQPCKLLNYLRIERPRVPSLLSQCGGAGTGCGWCVPFLRELHQQVCGDGTTCNLEGMSPAEYAGAGWPMSGRAKGLPRQGRRR